MSRAGASEWDRWARMFAPPCPGVEPRSEPRTRANGRATTGKEIGTEVTTKCESARTDPFGNPREGGLTKCLLSSTDPLRRLLRVNANNHGLTPLTHEYRHLQQKTSPETATAFATLKSAARLHPYLGTIVHSSSLSSFPIPELTPSKSPKS